MKVGIAFREIKGERFAVVVYDVTNPAPRLPDLYPCRGRAGSGLNHNKKQDPGTFWASGPEKVPGFLRWGCGQGAAYRLRCRAATCWAVGGISPWAAFSS